MSASALEGTLRKFIGSKGLKRIDEKKLGFFERLVDEALSADLLGQPRRIGEEPELATYSRAVFKQRNAVAHKGWSPDVSEASEVLCEARAVLEFIALREP